MSFIRGIKTEAFLCNAHLSILGMGDTLAFMINGDACAFVMGEGMENTPAFVIKGDMPLATRVSDINLTEMH
jgi:hypothetical protein